MKVFCVGPPKSGTVTLHKALTAAGLNCCHGKASLDQPPIAIQLWRAFIEGRNPLHYIPRGIEAIADAHLTRSPGWDNITLWPAFSPLFLQRFRLCNPETFILLHKRDPEAWLNSVNRWKNLRARLVKADLPFLPPSAGAKDDDMIEWITDHYKRVCDMFEEDKFFLSINIEDDNAPIEIGEALGLELPWWGVTNMNEETEDEIRHDELDGQRDVENSEEISKLQGV